MITKRDDIKGLKMQEIRGALCLTSVVHDESFPVSGTTDCSPPGLNRLQLCNRAERSQLHQLLRAAAAGAENCCLIAQYMLCVDCSSCDSFAILGASTSCGPERGEGGVRAE